MKGLATINIKFAANLKQFSSQMQNANRRIEKMGKNMQRVGGQLSLGVSTPLLGLGGLALQTASNFEQLEGRLKTSFRGNEEAAKKAFKTILDFTSKTPFQVEQVADAFIQLKNLGLDPSENALRSYGNTAAAMGKSLKQFIEAVADASTGEFERLKEFGIKAKSQGDQVSFTFQGVTKTVQKNAVEISKYLQDIGNINFAGAMDTQAQTLQGRLSNLKDTLSLLGNEFGSIILEYVKPLVDQLRGMVQRFRELSPETKKFIVILGGVAAAVGPLLAIAGTILPAIATGFTLLAGPVGLIVAGLVAIGTVIYKNWQPIKKELVSLANYFIDLYNESMVFRIAVEAIGTSFQNTWVIAKTVVKALVTLFKSGFKQMLEGAAAFGTVLKGILSIKPELITKGLKEFAVSTAKNFGAFADAIKTDFGEGWQDITKNIESSIDRILKKNTYKVEKIELSDAVKEIPTIKIPASLDLTSGTPKSGNAIGNGAVVGSQETQDSNSGFKPFFDEQLSGIQDFADQAQFMLEDAAVMAISGFVQGLVSGDLSGALNGILVNIADVMIQLGQMAIRAGLAIEGIRKALSSLKGPLAIAAGVALVALGTAIRNGVGGLAGNFAGSFANGGVVGGTSFSGDKLFARVNSGEMILNKRQQGNLLGMLQPAGVGPLDVNVQVEGVVTGENINLVTKRYQVKQRRNN